MKKILFASMTLLTALAFTACENEDFNEGIAGPLTTEPETPQTVSFGSGAVTEVASFNLADATSDLVKVCNITAPTVTDPQAVASGYTVTINKEELPLTELGEMQVEDLQNAIVAAYKSVRPVVRDLTGEVRAYYNANGQSLVTVSDPFTIRVIPMAPEIEAAYYLTGSINGWNNSDTTYKLTNDGSDPYDKPTFTLRIPASEDGSDIEFKMTPQSGLGGDWSKCLAAGAGEGTFVYNNAGGNLKIEAVEGAVFYDLVFNMLDYTWTCTPLLIEIEPAYYLTGSINGWNNSDTTYKLTNDGSDPYQNPTFTLRIPAPEDGSSIEFKMTPESGLGGDWSKCLAAGAQEGTFSYNNGGGNLYIAAEEGAKYYDLTFNMMELTWTCKAVKFEAYIWQAGNANGWGSPAAPLYGPAGDGKYTGYMYLDGEFKFRSGEDNWDAPDWGTGGAEGTLAQQAGNLSAAAGYYKVDADIAGMTYALTPITTIGIVGPAQAGGWGDDTDMTFNTATGAWEATIALAADELKFRANDGWDINWGGTTDNLTQGGANLKIDEAGTYFIQLFAFCDTKAYCVITKQ